jgi:hypothetical protein
MLRWFLNRQLNAFEREFDYDVTYTRDILGASLGAFWRFSRILGVASYRKDVPRDAWYAAKIAAALSEDCGPCTQLVVTMAERDGVSAANLRAILAADEQAMTPDATLGFRFAQSVVCRQLAEADTLRAEILRRWGRRALVSLALAISASSVFPKVKYALGHGHACTQVQVAGANAPLVVHRELRA